MEQKRHPIETLDDLATLEAGHIMGTPVRLCNLKRTQGKQFSDPCETMRAATPWVEQKKGSQLQLEAID
jgi:hypothetical protein